MQLEQPPFLQKIRFLNGGYCVQSRYLSGIPSFRFRRFQAVFISFEHPVHGMCLIDTGYGPDVMRATRRFPWRMLRWFTPIPKNQPFDQPNYLHGQQLDPQQIQHVFVSHFHADHIGGLSLFPESSFVYRADSLDQLNSLSSRKQLEDGFIPALLPSDFQTRGLPIAETQFSLNPECVEHFASFDYWDDGSLILIDLPGHAIGHTGYLLNTSTGPLLYVVDAFWDHRAFKDQSRLPWLSRRIQHSYEQYKLTNQLLLELSQKDQLTPLACHCPATQQHV